MHDNQTVLAKFRRKARKIYWATGKRKKDRSWTKTARALGVTRGTLIRVMDGYEPKEPSIRRVIGLPVYRPVAECLKCGQLHVTKRCTKKLTPEKRFARNAAAYDAWLASPDTQSKLAESMVWAISHEGG